MNKISEQKAMEVYPDTTTYRLDIEDKNKPKREGYIKGYDQAMQDFLEKAEKILTERMYFSDDEAKQFKNYIEKEEK